MSANKNYSKTAVQRKSFCKVCKDAGKEESVYTGHNLRNEFNKVMCPLLLSQSCFKCTALGHTPKYCPQNKIDEKIQKRKDYKERNEAVSKKNGAVRVSRSASYFGALCLETNEEVVAVVPEKKIKPKKAVESNVPTYASILRTPIEVKQPLVVQQVVAPKAMPAKFLRWADYPSSDDDDDEEEEFEEDYDY